MYYVCLTCHQRAKLHRHQSTDDPPDKIVRNVVWCYKLKFNFKYHIKNTVSVTGVSVIYVRAATNVRATDIYINSKMECVLMYMYACISSCICVWIYVCM